ncbi:TIR domain-containing protein [Virgibacillus halodenitrificans]|nr:TIR domain-containing protein [Virgibacillus halodenitrificans]
MIFLERLKIWYDSQISKISSNEFVLNLESHKIAHEQINNYYSSLSDELPDDDLITKSLGGDGIDKSNQYKGYRIFISHSSSDVKICTAFVHLLEALGVPEKSILYSSSERFGIPADMDIFEYLRSSIVEKFNVYYMLSDNYYSSVYCLNEMGAAWINQNEYSTYILPNLTGEIKGVIDSSKKGFRLDNPINLNQLRAKIAKDFNSSISDNKWEEEKNKFLKIVSET